MKNHLLVSNKRAAIYTINQHLFFILIQLVFLQSTIFWLQFYIYLRIRPVSSKACQYILKFTQNIYNISVCPQVSNC